MKNRGFPFEVGDLVRSEICGWTSGIIRKITRIEKDELCTSGYRIYADGGHSCPKGEQADPLEGIDSAWFELVDNCPNCEA